MRIKLFLGIFSTHFTKDQYQVTFLISRRSIFLERFSFQQSSQLFIFRSDPLNFSCNHFLSKISKSSRTQDKVHFLLNQEKTLTLLPPPYTPTPHPFYKPYNQLCNLSIYKYIFFIKDYIVISREWGGEWVGCVSGCKCVLFYTTKNLVTKYASGCA